MGSGQWAVGRRETICVSHTNNHEMTKLKDLVPGSKSDRYSFVSDSESLYAYDAVSKQAGDGDSQRGRSRCVTPRGANTPRGTTPRSITPGPGDRQSRSRDNTLRKAAAGATVKSS